MGIVMAPVKGLAHTVGKLPQVVDAVLVLPALLSRLERVNDNTDSLPDILGQLREVQSDTACLPEIHAELERMRKEIEVMRGTLGQVEQNTLAVERLAETVLPLQGAAARVGRFADRLPQRRFDRNGNGRGQVAGDSAAMTGSPNGNGTHGP
jgi:hypothetical protein